ncbi:flagellar motor switch protein FliG [Marimonas arenosa]|uniref:Flagellar motor switch protein FliG n=1 Tax=Marimonas arenosa TaxID=1795305 RepID=A0AAE3WAJ5_9RHOB|nr:FliG C-terminal domain-containing protein [Marimonas arenosa]MDQ2089084.1 flagellar motor switch protein FliG [Marimonas arenosa]
MRQLAQLSPPAAAPAPGRLDRRHKAAIIVRFLLQEGADVPLCDLPDAMQTELTQLMGSMRYVDRDTLEQVVGEFADELERMGLTFPRGLAGALSALDGKISPQTAARLRKEAGVRRSGDPWAFIRELETDRLVAVIERESTEVSAVLLSKLPVPKAAELLGRIPGEKARRITYAVSLTESVTPEAVDRIGLSLAAQLETQPLRAFDEGPDERLGSILNITEAAKRDEVLTGLDEDDADFSQRVRKAIFTFQHIATRIGPLDVPKIARDADPTTLTTAIAYALGSEDESLKASVEFLFANISKRMADNMREEALDSGKIKSKDGEAAMNAVVTTIRELQQSGEITFIDPDEEEED